MSNPVKNDPQEWREAEQEAQRMAAQVASDMMRRPGARWLLRPFHKIFKWIAEQCDKALKEDGWK